MRVLISIYRLKSRLLSLFFVMFVCFWACEQLDKKEPLESKKDSVNTTIKIDKIDSLTISVAFNEKGVTNFNVNDKYLYSSPLYFKNPFEKDTVITRKSLITYSNQVLNYSGGQFVDGKIKFYKHFYLMDSNVMNLEFEYANGDMILKTNKSVFLADTLFIKYNQFRDKANASLGTKLYSIT